MSDTKAVIFDLDDTLASSFLQREKQGQPIPAAYEVIRSLYYREEVRIGIASNRAGACWHEAMKTINPAKVRNYPTPEKEMQLLAKVAENFHGMLDRAQWAIALYDNRIDKAFQNYHLQVALYEPLDPHHPAALEALHEEENENISTIAKNVARWMEEENERGKRLPLWVGTYPSWRKPSPGMLIEFCQFWDLTRDQVIYCGDMDGTKLDRDMTPLDSDQEAARNAGMQFVPASKIQSILEMIS